MYYEIARHVVFKTVKPPALSDYHWYGKKDIPNFTAFVLSHADEPVHTSPKQRETIQNNTKKYKIVNLLNFMTTFSSI